MIGSAMSAEVEGEVVEEFGRVEASRRVASLLSPAAIEALRAEAEQEGAGAEEVDRDHRERAAVRLEVPRDRAGSSEPRIVPKRVRRLGQVDEMILSLYARGLSTREIQGHLA